MNKKILFLMTIFFVLGISCIFYIIKRYESKRPEIILTSPVVYINKPQGLTFQIEDYESGLRRANVLLIQKDLQKNLYSREFPGCIFRIKKNLNKEDIKINIDPIKMNLKEGNLKLVVTVYDYSWRNMFSGNISKHEQSLVIDLTPPALSCLSKQHYINQGGTGLIIYQTTDDSVKNGILAGDRFFSGFSVRASTYPNVYIAYFALPYDDSNPKLELISQDEAGNESRMSFYYSIRKKKFLSDSITVSDYFLQRKISQFYTINPTLRDLSLIESFKIINGSWREQNNQQIYEICQHSESEQLWDGKFSRLPNSKSSAQFADKRSYIYKGEKIDEQVHLGIDLASLIHSPVPAANNGKIVFQGEMGIYGKTIMIDHGQNIFTMYSHLNQYKGSLGKMVTKDEIIGNTGETGWAGGDHLHFAVLIGGTFVNPIEWWDKHWIEDNITLKLNILSE